MSRGQESGVRNQGSEKMNPGANARAGVTTAKVNTSKSDRVENCNRGVVEADFSPPLGSHPKEMIAAEKGLPPAAIQGACREKPLVNPPVAAVRATRQAPCFAICQQPAGSYQGADVVAELRYSSEQVSTEDGQRIVRAGIAAVTEQALERIRIDDARGRAGAARLAHNQESAGATPAPAMLANQRAKAHELPRRTRTPPPGAPLPPGGAPC